MNGERLYCCAVNDEISRKLNNNRFSHNNNFMDIFGIYNAAQQKFPYQFATPDFPALPLHIVWSFKYCTANI